MYTFGIFYFNFSRNKNFFGAMFITFNVNLIVVLNYIWFFTLVQLGYARIFNKNKSWSIKRFGEGVKDKVDRVKSKKDE